MNRTGRGGREDRTVDFFHHRYGTGRFGSYDDTVRMKEVADGGAFTKEFGIGNDVELKSIDIINRKMLPEALCGLYRHGAFFNHQSITARSGGYSARDGFNGAEVSLTVL